jgi:outer membrane protein assembly factor BamB
MPTKSFFFNYFLLFLLFTSCSLDTKTGIWSGIDAEKRKALRIQRAQSEQIFKVYSSDEIAPLKEKVGTKKVILSKPVKNNSWNMSGLNLQNNSGNLFITGVDNNFLKKKVGKNKFKIAKVSSTPAIFKNSIIMSDDIGTIYSIRINGKVKWKRNIYKKYYKKIYKNLSFAISDGIIFVSDNIGFVYALEFSTGKIIWIKSQKIPLKSDIKVYENKIYLVNQDNKIICLSVEDGSKVWDYPSLSSFIKLQNLLSLAISDKGELVTLNSSGDLLKFKSSNGLLYWSFDATRSTYTHDSDFFKSSQIVLTDDSIIFFASTSLFSFNLFNGALNWKHNIYSQNVPIIDGNNVFVVSNDGFFLNLDRKSGLINWSVNTFKILKESKQKTEATGVVLASGKLYITTKNGFLIECSASTGKVLRFKKIGDNLVVPPVVSNGSLYLLTENSKIIGFN